jgi:hypothetical protein
MQETIYADKNPEQIRRGFFFIAAAKQRMGASL